ncbi:universal stress protein [Phytohabitans houttuyneae]|uniref:Universal stress protein n=1 Tax=Phytohabitans houttuyneae TaxID=1076126 RepID=A0A6V8KFQ4_9ACTN|nr:universal stress protein [Phytohabitans houttuyneae]GFJ84052.1 universal stress protein [Phytohabitans houttuyneae]
MPESAPPIVVGFDASDGAHAALRWAMDEGARSGRPVSLVFAFDWPVNTGVAGLAPAFWPDYGAQEEADEVVVATVAEARQAHPGVPLTGTVVPGAATAVLVERSRQSHLVVLGGRGAGGFAGQLIGSTSISVSTHAHCPVVVVRGREPAANAPIVAGVDGSDYALMALEFAFAAAAGRGTGLRVVRAAERSGTRGDEDRAATAELVARWRDKYPQVATSVHIDSRPPAEALVDASGGAQLVVVGSRGRGGFRGMLLGSVSQQLLYHADCPVAVVRELPAR